MKYLVNVEDKQPDLDKRSLRDAVKGAVRRSFRNMGQICIAINRVYVAGEIYDKFLEKFKAETIKLVIANGLEKPDADIGPMANAEGLAEYLQLKHVRIRYREPV